MPISDYTFPVNQLLTYGKCHIREWPNYLELGLTQEHIPQLMKMVADEELQMLLQTARKYGHPYMPGELWGNYELLKLLILC